MKDFHNKNLKRWCEDESNTYVCKDVLCWQIWRSHTENIQYVQTNLQAQYNFNLNYGGVSHTHFKQRTHEIIYGLKTVKTVKPRFGTNDCQPEWPGGLPAPLIYSKDCVIGSCCMGKTQRGMIIISPAAMSVPKNKAPG